MFKRVDLVARVVLIVQTDSSARMASARLDAQAIQIVAVECTVTLITRTAFPMSRLAVLAIHQSYVSLILSARRARVSRVAQATQTATLPCTATLTRKSVLRFLDRASLVETTFLVPRACNARRAHVRWGARATQTAAADIIVTPRLEHVSPDVRRTLIAILRCIATLTRTNVSPFPVLDNHVVTVSRVRPD